MKPDLKYLFVSFFADGSHIEQTAEDRSLYTEGGSAFTDVVKYAHPVTQFHLVGEDKDYSVDLTTLNFAVNGTQFRLHRQEDLPLTDIRLLYFRRRSEHVEVSREGKIVGTESEINGYVIGYVGTTATGEEFTKFIEID